MLYRLLILCLFPLFLATGCNKSHNEYSRHNKQVDTQASLTALSPTNSMAYGRKSALNRHLEQVWLISSINDTPLTPPYYLDFRQLSSGTTILHTQGCPNITMRFDTSDIKNDVITLTEINRTISHCSNKTEDVLMEALSDIRYLKRHSDDGITLVSYQNTLTLTPSSEQALLSQSRTNNEQNVVTYDPKKPTLSPKTSTYFTGKRTIIIRQRQPNFR